MYYARPANGKVAPHSVTITPRKVENAERGRPRVRMSQRCESLRTHPPLRGHAWPPRTRAGSARAGASRGTQPTNGAIGAASRANGEEGRAIKRRAKGDKAKKQLDSFSVLAKAGAARPQ